MSEPVLVEAEEMMQFLFDCGISVWGLASEETLTYTPPAWATVVETLREVEEALASAWREGTLEQTAEELRALCHTH